MCAPILAFFCRPVVPESGVRAACSCRFRLLLLRRGGEGGAGSVAGTLRLSSPHPPQQTPRPSGGAPRPRAPHRPNNSGTGDIVISCCVRTKRIPQFGAAGLAALCFWSGRREEEERRRTGLCALHAGCYAPPRRRTTRQQARQAPFALTATALLAWVDSQSTLRRYAQALPLPLWRASRRAEAGRSGPQGWRALPPEQVSAA